MISTRYLQRTDSEKQQVRQRLLQYVDMLHVSDSQFCINAGLDRRYLNSFSGNPSQKVIRLITATYPSLSIDWVLYGKGKMITEEGKDNPCRCIPHIKSNVAQHYITPGVPNQVSEADPVTGRIKNTSLAPADREPVTLDGVGGHGLTEAIDFLKLLIEKDKIIAEKDKMIQFLLDQIQKLGMPCK